MIPLWLAIILGLVAFLACIVAVVWLFERISDYRWSRELERLLGLRD